MADALGVLAKAAFKKDRGLYGAGPAIAYPQVLGASDMAATHMIPFSSETMTAGLDYLKDPRLVGAGAQLPADVISDKIAGGVEGPLAYQGWERLLQCALGYENPDASPVLLATGAYAHLFECAKDLQDEAWGSGDDRTPGAWSANDRKVRRGQIGFRKQVTDWVFGSSMVNKMTISGNPTDVKIAFEMIGWDLYMGAYNSANWTLPVGKESLAIYPQLAVKVGTRAAGTAGLVTMGPSSFELSVNNNLKADDQTNTSGTHILQPCRGGMQEISLKLEFARYNSDLTALLGYADTGTELAASLVFTGPLIGVTAQYHSWQLFMSSIFAKNPIVSISGPGPLTTSLEFEVFRPSTTDMFNVVPATYYHSIPLKKDSALVACVHNGFATNYLLEV